MSQIRFLQKVDSYPDLTRTLFENRLHLNLMPRNYENKYLDENKHILLNLLHNDERRILGEICLFLCKFCLKLLTKGRKRSIIPII